QVQIAEELSNLLDALELRLPAFEAFGLHRADVDAFQSIQRVPERSFQVDLPRRRFIHGRQRIVKDDHSDHLATESHGSDAPQRQTVGVDGEQWNGTIVAGVEETLAMDESQLGGAKRNRPVGGNGRARRVLYPK